MTDQELKLLSEWSAASLAIDASKYPILQAFTPDRKPILTIHHDGRIEVGDGATPTETAKLVLEAMQGMVQEMLRQEWNRAIDAAIDMVAFNGGTVQLEAHIRSLKK